MPNSGLVALIRSAHALRIEGIGVPKNLPELGVFANVLEDVQHACEGSAAEGSAHLPGGHLHLGRVSAMALLERLLDHEGPEIRRDGVEPAAVHDARTSLSGLVVVRVDHRAN